jgi:hypothetical protein
VIYFVLDDSRLREWTLYVLRNVSLCIRMIPSCCQVLYEVEVHINLCIHCLHCFLLIRVMYFSMEGRVSSSSKNDDFVWCGECEHFYNIILLH